MARQRIHPEGTSATERVAASTASLKASGGARKTFRLKPVTMIALNYLMNAPDAPRTETELVEGLLLGEYQRRMVSGGSYLAASPSAVKRDDEGVA